VLVVSTVCEIKHDWIDSIPREHVFVAQRKLDVNGHAACAR